MERAFPRLVQPIFARKRISRMSNGIILFGTTTMLVKTEKLLINEGCTITRAPVPFDQHSGCAIGLRFPWSQYETIKSVLYKAS